MANIYLKFPTIEDKEKWIEYLKEYRLDNPKAKPLSCTENLNYEEWLKKIIKEHNGIDLQWYRFTRRQSTIFCLFLNE